MLPFLRCILCCEDEVHCEPDINIDVESLIRRFKRNPTSSFDYHQVPYNDNDNTFPNTISPSSYGTNSITHVSPQTTSRIQSQISSNSSSFSPKSRIPSIPNLQKETIPKINGADLGINPKRTPDKPTEIHTSAFQNNTSKNRSSEPYLSSSSSSFQYKLPPSEFKLPLSSSKASSSLSGPPPSLSSLSSSSSSSFGEPQSSPKPPAVSNKPILSRAPSKPATQQTKTHYKWMEKGATPLYVIPEDIKGLIKRDIVPEVLKKPLSPSTYKDYFASLLYAEDYYLEKWDGFEMKNVTLKLHKAEIHGRKGTSKNRNKNDEKDDKIFVEFEIDSIPEKRPFLLSRDFASVRLSGRNVEPFQGVIYRVVKSTLVLVEFGDDFHAQYYSSCKYDVKFSFNRVCLKRGHQAIAAASEELFANFLFPDSMPKSSLGSKQLPSISHKLDMEQVSAVRRILILKGSPPYLVEGPISVSREKLLSRTGVVVREAVVRLCQTSSLNRILICAPLNSTCDVLMRSLRKELLESDIFRANAAFRELDGVPVDILPFCPYKEECFSCPSLSELKKFKVILSTSMSTFRLHNEGIRPGHFSHIFLVDASSATEPETMVPLTNLANTMTTVVVTGAPRNQSGWVRSNIARQNGLKTSYFERLRESKLYRNLNPEFITELKDVGRKADDTCSSSSFY